MIEKVRSLSIHGSCFTNQTQLQFFPKDNDRISLVYGKNGSGKSTISRAFYTIPKKIAEEGVTASILDETGTPIEVPSDSIYVFNEAYIDRNVKVDGDTLGTIVLLGGQVDLQEEIETCQVQLTTATELHDTAQSEKEKYSDARNPIAPKYHWERIRSALQSSGGWAEMDSKIKALRRNSSVTDTLMHEICTMSVSQPIAELKKEFIKTQKLMERVTDSNNDFPMPIEQISKANISEENICTLLAEELEKPNLTEREKLILEAIQSGYQQRVEAAQQVFKKQGTAICPYCYQQVDEAYKADLLVSIGRVLNRDVERHKAALAAVVLTDITDPYKKYAELDSELVAQISTAVEQCNQVMAEYRKLLVQKSESVYTPIVCQKLGLADSIDSLNALLVQLENKRTEYNNEVKRKDKIKEKLILLNKQIAYSAVEASYKAYTQQKKSKEVADADVSVKEKVMLELSERLKMLKLRKANIAIAIESINNALNYVFFKKDRLSIELRDEKYYLKSNGASVKPKDISLGERNIIALCYFFTQMLENQEVSKLFQDKKLIVIDDPVSSFDFENKVGILSLLRYQMNKLITGNKDSKVLVFTHDLSVFFDLKKASNEICKEISRRDSDCKVAMTTHKLAGATVSPFDEKKGEYRDLIKEVYAYASDNLNANHISIGNTMRRVLESFSTFSYRESIDQVSLNEVVRESLGERSIYFENLMYRLVLHGESHFKEQVDSSYDGLNFYEFISYDEKKRTAKDILCFMYLLNKAHIKSYLGDDLTTIANIETWVSDIPKNCSFEIRETVGTIQIGKRSSD